MTNSINAPIGSGFPGKTESPLSMISMLAISVGMAAAPAHAQDMTSPDMTASPAPGQSAPVISPEPAPAAEPAPAVSQTRADDLATRGGFDAATVAPEALAQIERDQQARKDAAAASKSAAAAKPAPARAASAPVTDSATRVAPAFDSDGSAGLAETTADPAAVIPMIAPVSDIAPPPEAIPADNESDWSLLAALAAMLGIGSAGAYATSRRRSRKTRQAAALNAAIMPELRRDSVKEEIRRRMDVAQPPVQPSAQAIVQPTGSNVSTKVAFADFVANLPAFEAPQGTARGGVKIGQRRVAAAPRPYLAEADLSRPAGYFTANVDSMPTPQNPFLTREKRLKRARYLDGKLAERNASTGDSRNRIGGKMEASRPLEPAFA